LGTSISLAGARRIALRAAGFGGGVRPRRPAARDVERVIARLGALQFDFVNVLIPAHYQVVFSRLGPYRDGQFDEAVYGSGRLSGQWAHKASVIPVETCPLLKPGVAEFRIRHYGFERFLGANGAYVTWAIEEMRRRGLSTAIGVAGPEGQHNAGQTCPCVRPGGRRVTRNAR
jgi:uncharacterized protein YcaQ